MMNSRSKVLLTFVVAALSFTGSSSFPAIPPELISQVIEAASNNPLDEVLFVAANLLDNSNSQTNQRIPPLLSAAKNNKISLSVRLPDLTQATTAAVANDLYEYESSPLPGSLALTAEEEALFRLVRNVRNKYSPSTTVRVAGGWVRDKLLYGRDTPSRDIDFVLSDTSGDEFADKVCRYLREEITGSDKDEFYLEQMPEKSSKGEQADHLQTASLSINGFDLDFGRLRYERYDRNSASRIPEKIGVASVVEDAWRRDLTINALYYNVNTNQVEDWTERGISDLIMKNVATPKEPLSTLLEDPMRILRAIRFASQLSFNMSPALVRAARDVRVRYAMRYKVSRDAIGKAIDEMFGTRARDPTRGIRLLIATNLIDVVFPLKDQDDNIELGGEMNGETSFSLQSRTLIYASGLDRLSRTQSLVTRIFLLSSYADWDISKRRYLWYAAFLQPLYNMTELSSSASNSKRSRRRESAFYQLLGDEGLKRTKNDIQSIDKILKGANSFRCLLESGELKNNTLLSNSENSLKDISDLRWLMYETLKPIGSLWKEALILALTSDKSQNLFDCVDEYNDLVELIDEKLGLGPILLDESTVRPLLNGAQIQERALPGVSGKGFKRVMQAQEEWQVRNNCCQLPDTVNGDESDVEAQFIEYLAATFPEYARATCKTKE